MSSPCTCRRVPGITRPTPLSAASELPPIAHAHVCTLHRLPPLSSMPLLYLIGVAWLAVIELVDRHALTKLCRRPVRYGPRLPYLLLGARSHTCRRSVLVGCAQPVWVRDLARARRLPAFCRPQALSDHSGACMHGPIPRSLPFAQLVLLARNPQTSFHGQPPATAPLGCGCTPTSRPRAAPGPTWSASTAQTRCWPTWLRGERRLLEMSHVPAARAFYLSLYRWA